MHYLLISTDSDIITSRQNSSPAAVPAALVCFSDVLSRDNDREIDRCSASLVQLLPIQWWLVWSLWLSFVIQSIPTPVCYTASRQNDSSRAVILLLLGTFRHARTACHDDRQWLVYDLEPVPAHGNSKKKYLQVGLPLTHLKLQVQTWSFYKSKAYLKTVGQE